jgi:hypothetical protein
MYVSNEPFVGQSTTKDDYQKWSAKPAEAIRPAQSAASTGPDDRDFATENGSKFNSKGFVARVASVPATSHVFDREPFAGESSMKDAYKQWENSRPSESCRPVFAPQEARKDERQFRTEKQDNYNRHNVASVVRHHAQPSQVLDSAPFAGQSVTKADYTGHRGARPAELMKPDVRTAGGGDEERDFRSENADKYKSKGKCDAKRRSHARAQICGCTRRARNDIAAECERR